MTFRPVFLLEFCKQLRKYAPMQYRSVMGARSRYARPS